MLGPKEVVILFLAVIAVAACVRLAFRAEDVLIKARKELIALSSLLTRDGLPHLATICSSLAVGDLAEVVKTVRYLVVKMETPESASSLLDTCFSNQLTARLADATEAPDILKQIAALGASTPALLKAAGLAIVAVA
jgi:hypothetical protein